MMHASSETPVRLQCGPLELAIEPALGACCSLLRYQRPGQVPIDILRALSPGVADPFASGCFVTVPYSNRLFGGTLLTRSGGQHAIATNRKGVAMPVHGVAWMKRWFVHSSTRTGVTLGYRHAADQHWPYSHACALTVTLSGHSARFALELQNLSAEAMPAGLGFHPYLMIDSDALLRFHAGAAWLQDADGVPSLRVSVAGDAELDFETPRNAASVELNHCFAQWSGVADLRRSRHELTVRITADANLGHLVVYRPAAQEWICIEPVSHASGALSMRPLHSRTHGLRWLSPRRRMRAAMEIAVISSLA